MIKLRQAKWGAVLAVCCGAMLLSMVDSSIALAADSASVVSDGTGLGGNFDKQLSVIGNTFVTLAKLTVMILTAVAAIQVGLGTEDHKKVIWNWLLGAGLAVNFGLFLSDVGFLSMVPSGGGGAVTFYTPEVKDKVDDVDWLSEFMGTYLNNVVTPGSKNIMPYCCSLLMILAVIEGSWELSFKLISGDKVKYMLTMIIKIGFFLFLMLNWITLCEALGQGFQQIGFAAGGVSYSGDPAALAANLQPDSIWKNACKMCAKFWEDAHFTIFDLGLSITNIVSVIAIFILAALTALEMFVARIEFYTMALICLPLIPFLITSKFTFLGEKAIGAMFNLAIKLSVIAFVTAMAGPMLASYEAKIEATGGWNKIGIILQTVFCMLIIYYLVKKIPDLVTGLLNGQPQLGGSGMKDMMTSAAKAPVAATGSVAAAHKMAAAKNGGKAGALSTLKQLGVNQLARNPITQAYRVGMSNFENRANNTSSRIGERINRIGEGKLDPNGDGSTKVGDSGKEAAVKNAENYTENNKLPPQ